MHRGMVDITIAYIVGVVIASHFLLDPICLLVAMIGALALIWFGKYRNYTLMNLGLAIMLVSFGCLNTVMRTGCPADDDVSMFANVGIIEVYGTVWEEPITDEGQTIFTLKVSSAVAEGIPQSVSGYLRVMIRHLYGPVVSPDWGDILKVVAPIYMPNVPSNPGQSDFAAYLERRGVYSVAYVYPWNSVNVLGKAQMPCLAAIRIGLLTRIRQCVNSSVSHPYNALLLSLLLGEKHSLPKDVIQSFEGAGILHVLTVSGLHVGFAGLMLLWLATILGVDRKKAAVVSFVGILMYAFVVGFRASVVRATIMTGMMFLGIIIDRERDLLTALALAAFLICLTSPTSIFDVGFQLSFAAVFGILQLPSLVDAFLPPMPKWLGDPLSVSLSASLATLPLLAFYFNSICPVGVIANLICVPIAGLCVKLGFVLVCLGSVSTYFAKLAGIVVSIALRVLLTSARIFSSIPGSIVYVGTPSRWFMMLYYCLMLWVVFPEKLNPFLDRGAYYRRKGVIALYFLVALLVWVQVIDVSIPRIEITFLDVGFGDAIFIRTHTGHTLLIDGGSGSHETVGGFDSGLHVVLPFLRHKGITRIDVVALSHPHEDHVGGLVSVIQGVDIGLICDVAVEYASATYELFLKTLAERQLELLKVSDGTTIQLGKNTTIQILHPPQSNKWSSANVNNHSAVMKVEFANWSFMLAGDIEEEAEKRLVAGGADLKAQVLKVAHHGSNTSTGTDFLRDVMPEIAVISVGRNSYGLPSAQVISQLEEENVKVYRTDHDGAITIIGRKKSLEVRTVK